MIIYLASDHAGFELKKQLKEFLMKNNYEVEDMGPFTFKARDDYPDFMHPLAKIVSFKGEEARGIIIGGSGQGEGMVANRHKGVRSAVYYGGKPEIVRISREHNNSNVLAIGARFVKKREVLKAVDVWLKEPFSKAARHVRRLKKIDK
jgi:ribose 5-phosphate isomerase B